MFISNFYYDANFQRGGFLRHYERVHKRGEGEYKETQSSRYNNNHSIVYFSLLLEPQSAPKKRRQRNSFFSTIFCCFGSQQSGKASFQPKPGEPRPTPVNNTASVIHQAPPNNNQNTLTQCYQQDEREEEIDVNREVWKNVHIFILSYPKLVRVTCPKLLLILP